jgi:hypothetical protein
MTVPAFTPSGVLPPFLADPTDSDRSPYRATLVEFVSAFGTSAHRRTLIRGLIRYRAELARVGATSGYQWIDGSFVERLSREPGDIDVVTFVRGVVLPTVPADRALFDPKSTKTAFHCDAYFVSLTSSKLVEHATYWFGLFSHRRSTMEWKGMLQIDLDASIARDADALAELDSLDVAGVMES